MVLFQKPNLLLTTGFVLVLLSKLPTNLRDGFSVAGDLVLSAWAIDEIRHGVNWFRRLLGSVVLVALFMSLISRIAR